MGILAAIALLIYWETEWISNSLMMWMQRRNERRRMTKRKERKKHALFRSGTAIYEWNCHRVDGIINTLRLTVTIYLYKKPAWMNNNCGFAYQMCHLSYTSVSREIYGILSKSKKNIRNLCFWLFLAKGADFYDFLAPNLFFFSKSSEIEAAEQSLPFA